MTIEKQYARIRRSGPYTIVMRPWKDGPWTRPFFVLEWWLR
jgi:hypothetical protein